VEKLPNAQKPLQPNGLGKVVPIFNSKPDLFNHWWPEDLQDAVGMITGSLPAREAQIASRLELLMQVSLNPNERWWQGLTQQLSQAQLSRAQPSSAELKQAMEALQLQGHADEWHQQSDQCCGQALNIAPGLTALNLGDTQQHQSRNPGASFRAIHFDPEPSKDQPQQEAIWRE